MDDPRAQTPQALAKTWQPRQLVAAALHLGPPLSGWNYSNTNYILAGMIIQKVTGHSPMDEISRRILRPLGLHATSFPLTSRQIPGTYAHGYFGGIDVTNMVNPSGAWTAGAMISTVDDVARFYRAGTRRRIPRRVQVLRLHQPGRLPPGHDGLQRLQDE